MAYIPFSESGTKGKNYGTSGPKLEGNPPQSRPVDLAGDIVDNEKHDPIL
jgi:hypothetical protein